jgi:hypothetical protein
VDVGTITISSARVLPVPRLSANVGVSPIPYFRLDGFRVKIYCLNPLMKVYSVRTAIVATTLSTNTVIVLTTTTKVPMTTYFIVTSTLPGGALAYKVSSTTTLVAKLVNITSTITSTGIIEITSTQLASLSEELLDYILKLSNGISKTVSEIPSQFTIYDDFLTVPVTITSALSTTVLTITEAYTIHKSAPIPAPALLTVLAGVLAGKRKTR